MKVRARWTTRGGNQDGLIPNSSGRYPSSKKLEVKLREMSQGTTQKRDISPLLKSKRYRALKEFHQEKGQLKPYWAPTASTQGRALLCLLLAPNSSFHLGEVWWRAQKSSRGAPFPKQASRPKQAKLEPGKEWDVKVESFD